MCVYECAHAVYTALYMYTNSSRYPSITLYKSVQQKIWLEFGIAQLHNCADTTVNLHVLFSSYAWETGWAENRNECTGYRDIVVCTSVYSLYITLTLVSVSKEDNLNAQILESLVTATTLPEVGVCGHVH